MGQLEATWQMRTVETFAFADRRAACGKACGCRRTKRKEGIWIVPR